MPAPVPPLACRRSSTPTHRDFADPLEADATGRVLVVDETRRSGGVSEGVVTALVDDGFTGAIRRVTSEDSFIPLGDAALTVLLDEDTIEVAAVKLVHQ